MTLRALVLAIASMLMLAPLARASDDAAGWSGGFLGWRADHYFDRSGEATFEELAGPDAAKFLPSNGRVANLGAARQRGEALWLRVPIPKLAGPAMSNWVLSFNESRARHVTLFVPDPSTGGIVTASWSFTQSARPGVPNTRFAAFELTADQLSEKVVYLRVETLSSMRANLWLTPASGFLSDYARQGLGFGALAGALVALTFYSLALGVATGEKALIALGGLAVSIAFYSLADAGFVETLLFPGAAVVSRAISFGGTFVTYVAALAFSAFYLQAPLASRLGRNLVLGLGVLLSCAALAAVIDVVTDSVRLRPVSGLIGVSFLVSLAAMAAVTLLFDWRRALGFFACWTPALATGVMRLSLDAFPSALSASPIDSAAFYPGITISMLSFAIVTSLQVRGRLATAISGLAASERRLQDYSVTASDDFWETDAKGVITRVTDAMRPPHGLRVGDSLFAWIDRNANPANLLGPEKLKLAFASSSRFRGIQIDCGSASDGDRHISLSGQPVVDAADPAAAWRGTVTEVTRQVVQERERSRERTMVGLGIMVGAVAHEINNLLHPIVNMSRLALERMLPDDPNRRVISIIGDSGRRAGEIVNNVLGVVGASNASGRAPFGRAVAESLATLETLGKSRIRIEARIETLGGPEIQTAQAFQILSNLIGNAAKAIDYDGVIEVRLSEAEAGKRGRSFVLSVADHGVGMTQSTRLRAQEALFTTARQGEGSGLGLSIVTTIVDSLGGSIDIEFAPGRGTVVTITLTQAFVGGEKPESAP